jgi:NAD-dependent dihydropyrimidine dehydrogenase PreA subunit
MSSGTVIEIDSDLCDNTHACHAVCPEDVFTLVDGRVQVVNRAACTLCFKCMESCPSGAMTIDY